jgi:hypothetical protein
MLYKPYGDNFMLFSKRLYSTLLFLFTTLFVVPAFAGATPQEIQGYIAHANPAKALQLLGPILKNDPHSAKAWYLKAEALDAQGNTTNAKAALLTAEHLSPAMSFANPTDLKRLEQRIGVRNVARARSTAHLMSILGLVAIVLLGIFGVFMFAWFKKKTELAEATEKRRSDILIAITTFISEDLKRALISANASDDATKVAAIQSWTTSLLDAARELKDAESANESDKLTVVRTAEQMLESRRSALNGNGHVAIPQNNSGQRDTLFDGLQGGHSMLPDAQYRVSDSVQPRYVPSNSGSGGGFVDALEQGFGLGIGMTVAEDILDGSSGGNDSFGVGNNDGFGVDNQGGFGSGNNDQDSFGGTDDGLTSGSDSFGSDDVGLTDDSTGGTDDGLDDSSTDDSW